MRMNDDGRTVAAADCLVPGVGEIIGGSQREERLDVLLARMEQLGLNPDDYWWYLDLRRYGSCRHAGYGMGFERLVMYLTGVSNIRDVELHPRTTGNADFYRRTEAPANTVIASARCRECRGSREVAAYRQPAIYFASARYLNFRRNREAAASRRFGADFVPHYRDAKRYGLCQCFDTGHL